MEWVIALRHIPQHFVVDLRPARLLFCAKVCHVLTLYAACNARTSAQVGEQCARALANLTAEHQVLQVTL